MLDEKPSYEALYRDFRWSIPERFNIARAVADDWAARDPDRICLEHFEPDGQHRRMTYGALAARSSSLAHGLSEKAIGAGDRVAILLPQGFETVISHLAAYRIGAIAVPLALLFGAEALEYRLRHSGAKVVITNRFGLERLAPIRADLPDLDLVVLVDDRPEPGTLSFQALSENGPQHFPTIDGSPDDPAMMIYTSGTTGPPKGALHGHRVLLGHLPGFQMHHEFLPQPGDRIWTPSDWAWAGGLLNVLLPALLLGVPVVSSPGQKFDPEMACRIMAEMDVRNAFIPPTALRLMKSVDDPRGRYGLNLRTVSSAGEALGRDAWEWVRDALGVTVNEFYGQTECNMVIGSIGKLGVSRPGPIGRAIPGHEVAIIDGNGRVLGINAVGEIAVRRPDPVMFLGYWNDEAATRAKFAGDWLRTGDLGRMDDEGYITFFGREDDVITSSGYRIGPSEIEDCLAGHPAVRLAAAIGKPDPVRTEIVKAYVVLKPGYQAGEGLAEEIRQWVKGRLSMHEYPREVEFVESLPLTTSGKVIRHLLRKRSIETARSA
jgi:acetyl-CoA synthetase